MSWRYKGGPGCALADIGSLLVDLAEFLCGPIRCVRGAVLTELGRAFAQQRTPDGTVVRFRLAGARTWDRSRILPAAPGEPGAP